MVELYALTYIVTFIRAYNTHGFKIISLGFGLFVFVKILKGCMYMHAKDALKYTLALKVYLLEGESQHFFLAK